MQAWLPKNMVIVNKHAWDSLDEATQTVVRNAAADAEAAGWAKAEELSDWYKEQLAAKGMEILPPSDQLKADFKAIGMTMTNEWLERAGEIGKAAIEAFNAM